jgi:uncharacterized protein YdaT
MENEYKNLFENILSSLRKIEGIDIEKAVNIACILVQEYGKDRRVAVIQQSKSIQKNGNSNDETVQSNDRNEKATFNQLKYMKQLGIKIHPGITKIEASKLIDMAKENL